LERIIIASFLSTALVCLTFSISRGVAWRGTGLPVPVPRPPWPLRAGPVTGQARRLHAAVRRRLFHSNSTGWILRQGRPEVKRFFSRPAVRDPLGRRTGYKIEASFAGSPSYLPRKHSGRGTLDHCATTPQWCSWCRRTSTARGPGREVVAIEARCPGRARPAKQSSPTAFSSIYRLSDHPRAALARTWLPPTGLIATLTPEAKAVTRQPDGFIGLLGCLP
jgi:hypothetical protein